MGISGIGLGELLLILAIILLLFGSNKLSNLGSDLGSALRGFRSALRSESDQTGPQPPAPEPEKNGT